MGVRSKFTDRNIRKEVEEEKKEEQKQDEEYVGDQEWLNVTVLDETNEDEVTLIMMRPQQMIIQRTISMMTLENEQCTNTTVQNDDDNDDYDEGVDGDQSNDNESSNEIIL